MQEIEKMQGNHMYLIEGTASANSSYFENEADCKSFMRLADKYLGAFMKINCFQNNKDGWAMIVSTRSAAEIKKAYSDRRKQSKKCKKACAHHAVWRMLSDQVRIWLSTYVKASNQKSGRTGGKVSSKYRRFIFESVEEAEKTRLRLSKQAYNQAQKVKRYRASKKLFKIKKKVMKRSVFVCSAALVLKRNVEKLGLRCLDLGVFVEDVLRQHIFDTLNHHFPTATLKPSPT